MSVYLEQVTGSMETNRRTRATCANVCMCGYEIPTRHIKDIRTFEGEGLEEGIEEGEGAELARAQRSSVSAMKARRSKNEEVWELGASEHAGKQLAAYGVWPDRRSTFHSCSVCTALRFLRNTS